MKKYRLSLNGSGKYYKIIEAGTTYFLKVGEKRMGELKKEFQNLKKLNKKKISKNIVFPKPVKFDEKNKLLTTSYIKGINLEKFLKPNIFFNFGKELQKLHKANIIHGHLEVSDIIYFNDKFYICDLGRLGENDKKFDFFNFKISLYFQQLKRPWLWSKIEKCNESFSKGYGKYKGQEKEILGKELKKDINSLRKKGIMGNIKAVILIIFLKRRFQ